MRRHFSPPSLLPPPGRYHHAVHLRGAGELLAISGQLGIAADGTVPAGVAAQAALVFAALDACLGGAGLGRADLLRLTTFLVDLGDREAYMRARDAWVPEPPPASTLVIVKGLARPECRVEVEALAARATPSA